MKRHRIVASLAVVLAFSAGRAPGAQPTAVFRLAGPDGQQATSPSGVKDGGDAALRVLGASLPLTGCAEAEPNEVPAQASFVTLGSPCTGAASFADPTSYTGSVTSGGTTKQLRLPDVWKVTLGAASSLTVTLTFANTADLDFFIEDANLSLPPIGIASSTGTILEGFVIGNLPAGTYYILIGVASGSSAYTLTVNATAVGGGGAPAASNALSAQALDATTVQLQWVDNSSNETEFRIEAKTTGSFGDIGGVGANVTTVTFLNVTAGSYTFRVRARNLSGDSLYSNEASVTVGGAPPGACVPSATTLCLQANRFKLEGTYLLQNNQGSGSLTFTKLTDASGYWVHDNASDVQAIVKVLNVCGVANNKYWVFVGALTNQQVHLVVTDTKTNTVKVYDNPLQHVFAPVQDTNAFATCP